MAADPESNSSETSTAKTEWEGYADYRVVSGRIAKTIDDAVESYAIIDARHSEGAAVHPELASDARASIMSAAMMLQFEMEQDREQVELYGEILDKWTGEEGYINRMDGIHLSEGRPGWLYDFVLDIRKAGWRLGYLQAGRTQSAEPQDPVEKDVEAMF